jgi:hypothetical protein
MARSKSVGHGRDAIKLKLEAEPTLLNLQGHLGDPKAVVADAAFGVGKSLLDGLPHSKCIGLGLGFGLRSCCRLTVS